MIWLQNNGTEILSVGQIRPRFSKRKRLTHCASPFLSLLDIVFFNILEISIGIYLEFSHCKFICHDDAVRMSLKG